jgi:hypothetical protein
VRGIGILRSSHSGDSANFALTEFSEVRRFLGAPKHFVPWRTYISLPQEYVRAVTSDGVEE